MKRVYIQQNCIAHYREAMFELLSSNKEMEFTFIADSKSDTPFMKVVQWDASVIRRRCENSHPKTTTDSRFILATRGNSHCGSG